jgi:hypothetical protein
MITAAEFRHGCCGQGTPVEISLVRKTGSNFGRLRKRLARFEKGDG